MRGFFLITVFRPVALQNMKRAPKTIQHNGQQNMQTVTRRPQRIASHPSIIAPRQFGCFVNARSCPFDRSAIAYMLDGSPNQCPEVVGAAQDS
jgi:hypothetical protein